MTGWEISLQISKFIALAVSAASGVYATIGETKSRESGKLTESGRVVLTCVILSLVVGLTSQSLETKSTIDRLNEEATAKKAAATKEAEQRRSDDAARALEMDQLKNILKTARLASSQSETSAKQSAAAVKGLKQVSKGMDETLLDQHSLLESGKTLQESQRSLLQSGARLQEVMLRSEFPLEPLELTYTFGYSMTDPRISGYVEHVRGQIIDYLVKHPASNHASPSDELVGQKWYLTDPEHDWQPQGDSAASALLSDRTTFWLKDTDRGFNNEVRLDCTPGGDPFLDAHPSSSKTGLKILLVAHFKDGYIEKRVTCSNPYVGGNDVIVSPIDLLGRRVTWDLYENPKETRTLLELAFTFPKLGRGSPVRPTGNPPTMTITRAQLNIIDFIKLDRLIPY